MKTLAPASQGVFNSPKPKYFKRVQLYRRSWNGSAFVYDDAIDVTPDTVEVGKIQIKLDTEAYNKWTYSNCALTLSNDRQQWQPGNPDGYFPAGKYLFNSKIRIIAGVVRPDGTQDPQYLYTGYLAEEPTYYPDAKTVQLSLVDHMSVFAKFSAEAIGTVVTNESVGSDSGTAFFTANKAVGIISKVLKGQTSAGPESADELDSGTDYNVGDLNEHDTGAKITLNSDLGSGQSVWASYTCWYLDKPLEWVAAQLCALCGITQTAISPVVFGNSVKNTFAQSNEADFNNAALGAHSNTAWGTYFWQLPNGVFPNVDCVAGYYHSAVIDGGAALKSWLHFSASFLIVGANPPMPQRFSIRTSADNAAWGDWSAINDGDLITTAHRYIQLRFFAGQRGPEFTNDVALLYSWSVDWLTSTTNIPIVNMTGLTCEAALQQLAEMSSYEIGFDASDTFIFRPRTDGSPAVDTLDNAKVSGVDNVTDGSARLYTRVKVDFGDYSAAVDCDTQNEPAPNNLAVYGVLEYSVSSGNFLPSSTVDLAQSIALTVYAYVKDLRRRAQVRTRFFLHLELGDKVTLKIVPQDYITAWRWGDGKVRYGHTSRAYYYTEDWLAVRLPLYRVDFRVEGVELDVENWKTTFNLTEAR